MAEIFKLSEDWGDLAKRPILIPFGIGRIGRRVLPVLMSEFQIPFLIDNNIGGDTVMGLEVKTLKDAVPYLKENSVKVIVTTMNYSYDKICGELREYGLKENVDFCLFERFAEEWNLRWKNRCVLSKIDTVITSNCTLRCKNCNMFIAHTEHHRDLPLEELQKNFDSFFRSVDFVYEYTLLGGEPFLHKDIAKILTILGEQYRDRIGQITLISNGTVVPQEEVLDLLAKYRVTVHISDYTKVIGYEAKLDEVKTAFERKGIVFYVIPSNTWKDVVYPEEGYRAKDPRAHMIACGHSTHSVAGGRLYWCDPAFGAEYFMGFAGKEDDSLDLEANRIANSKFDAAVNIMKYLLGDVNERGYMSICEFCAGVGADNQVVVVAGVQKGKEN